MAQLLGVCGVLAEDKFGYQYLCQAAHNCLLVWHRGL